MVMRDLSLDMENFRQYETKFKAERERLAASEKREGFNNSHDNV